MLIQRGQSIHQTSMPAQRTGNTVQKSDHVLPCTHRMRPPDWRGSSKSKTISKTPQRRVIEGKSAILLRISRPVRFGSYITHDGSAKFRKFRLFERGSAFDPACLAYANFIAPHECASFLATDLLHRAPAHTVGCLFVFSPLSFLFASAAAPVVNPGSIHLRHER